jgi:hypothetical protein
VQREHLQRTFGGGEVLTEMNLATAHAEGALDDELVDPLLHLPSGRLLAAPPRRHGGHEQVFTKQFAAQPGKEGHHRWCFGQAGAHGVRQSHVASTNSAHEAICPRIFASHASPPTNSF